MSNRKIISNLPAIKTSLQRQMILTLSGVIIGLILLVGLPIIFLTVQIQQQESVREQQVLANQVGRTVASILASIQDNQVQFPATLTNDPRASLLINQVTSVVNQNIADVARQLQQELHRSDELEIMLSQNNAIQGLSLFTLEGTPLQSVWRSSQLADSGNFNQTSFQQAAQGIPTLDSLFITDDNVPIVVVTTPILEGERVSQVVVVWVSVQGIWPYVTNLQVGQTGYLYIIDQAGELVAVPSEYQGSPVPNLDVSNPPEGSYRGLSGERVIGRVAPIANTPWWVVIEIPSREANASLRALVAVLGAILMFGMSAAILVARLFSQWLLAPISQLQESAERISEGDLSHRVHLNRADELGFLGEAINQMVATLESTITELRELSLRLISAQETERQRIARQIHDELGQTLTALKLNLWMSQRNNPDDGTLAAAAKLASDVQDTARSLSHELRPAMLDDLGLQPTLHWLIDRLEQRANLAISLEADVDESQLSAQLKTTLYRLVAEALTNITKHAQASVVEILMYPRDETLTLIIVDDGVGFDTAVLQTTQSLGVDGMRERVNLLQGDFTIESKPGEGTKIVIELPQV